jgi:murein DD-endopeptidase MepM/ murein hydrolase activator NlpD
MFPQATKVATQTPVATTTPQPTQTSTPIAVSTPTPSPASSIVSDAGYVSPVNGGFDVLCAFEAACGYGANGHNGLDIVSMNDPGADVDPTGDMVAGRDVFAIADGTITGIYGPPDCDDAACDWSGLSGKPGITIDVMHGSERWQYTHVNLTDEMVNGFAAAQKSKKPFTIQRGQKIGYYSQIGASTGPHLHLSRWIWSNDNNAWQLADPQDVLPN